MDGLWRERCREYSLWELCFALLDCSQMWATIFFGVQGLLREIKWLFRCQTVAFVAMITITLGGVILQVLGILETGKNNTTHRVQPQHQQQHQHQHQHHAATDRPSSRHGSAAVVTSDITFVVVSLANLGFALMNAVKVYQVLGAASVNTLTDNQRQLFHHALGLLRVSLRLACVITALLVVVVGVVFASFYWLKTPWYGVCCLVRVAQPTPASNPGLVECLVACIPTRIRDQCFTIGLFAVFIIVEGGFCAGAQYACFQAAHRYSPML